MNFKSAIYTGSLHHRRTKPKAHDFRYSVAMFYVDLSEIKQIFKLPFLFSWRGPSLVLFRRKDYLKGHESLVESVRAIILAKTGKASAGAIRLFTQIRYFGFCFNPVSFYYCFDENEKLKFIVTEITNTPWNERQAYVHEVKDDAETARFEFKKDFHVSPFLPMDLHYIWEFNRPVPANVNSRLRVHMEDWDLVENEKVFEATLVLKPSPMTATHLLKTVFGFPLLTVKTFLAIYFQALRLKLKGAHFYSHPQSGENS
jgi:DUF1365 family protein